MLFHVDGTTGREVAQKTVGLSKCDVNTLTVHLLESCPHEPTSIMANVQRKLKKKYEAWLPHCVYPSLTANLPEPTC